MNSNFGFGYVVCGEYGLQLLEDDKGNRIIATPRDGYKTVVFADIEEASRFCASVNAYTDGGFEVKTAYDWEVIRMPKINFHAFATRTKDELDLFVEQHPAYDFVVYMRYKYDYENLWTYNFELLLCEDSGDFQYVMKNDWDEGQQCVEYLGIAVLDIPVNEEIGREDQQ